MESAQNFLERVNRLEEFKNVRYGFKPVYFRRKFSAQKLFTAQARFYSFFWVHCFSLELFSQFVFRWKSGFSFEVEKFSVFRWKKSDFPLESNFWKVFFVRTLRFFVGNLFSRNDFSLELCGFSLKKWFFVWSRKIFCRSGFFLCFFVGKNWFFVEK